MAQAILLQDVEPLGKRGTVVEVSKGYLRNYLLPRNLAAPATPAMLEEARRRQEAEERARREAEERAEQNAQMLSRTVLTIPAQAGPDGRLFGSVGQKDIVEAIKAARQLKLDRRQIHLPEPLKSVGTYMVEVELPGGRRAKVKTIIVAQEKRS
jgi:large subunit ribosomal protein L9